MIGKIRVSLLCRLRIRPQPGNVRATVVEDRGGPRGVEGVYLAPGESFRQRLSTPDRRHVEALRQIQIELLVPPGLLEATGEVADAVRRDAVMLGEDAANPHAGRELIFGVPDDLAPEVFGLSDPAGPVNEHTAVSECSRREDRDCDHRRIGIEERGRVSGKRHLGDLELAIAKHAEERLLHGQSEIGEVDPLGLHFPVPECARPVVVATRECEA
jgi:hypothetical protein